MGRINKKAPRISVLGCGAITESYYMPALIKYPSILEKLVLVDKDKARLQKIALQFHVHNTVEDFHEILGGVDGVILALPTDLHHAVCIEFLSQGIPVLCEKPLAESGDKAREILAQSQKTGTALAVNYFQRLIPAFAKVKQLLTDGVLGELQNIEYIIGEKFGWPTVSGFYFNSSPASRGILRDRGSHVLDHICWWLSGRPELVSCFNDSFGGSEAQAHINFRNKSCFGEVRLSWLSNFPDHFLLKGSEASVEGEVYDYRT